MLIACLFLSAADPALAQQLRGYDNDLSAHVLTRLVTDPVGALIAAADDGEQPTFVRARALELLGHYLESRTLAALVRLSGHALPELRVKALKGLRFFAQRMPETADDPAIASVLQERLADGDRFVRMQAVRAAAVLPAQHAHLRLLRAQENDAGVRRTFDDVLR